MKLLAKFNLILVALFGAGSILIAYTAYQFLMRNARSQVIQQAELMIESARSTRQYTANELAPLLETLPDHKTRFLPETIPFYAATVTFDYLRKQYPDYSYKEAALNPTNLRDRAAEWEADLISYFRNHTQCERSWWANARLPPDACCTSRARSPPSRPAWSVTARPPKLLRPLCRPTAA